MDYNKIKNSLKTQVENKVTPTTFEVTQTQTVIKEYNSGDLPAYFKWDLGSKPWYFRVRVRQGRIVTDLLKHSSEGYELTYSTLQSAFDTSNKPIDKDVWRNALHDFINELK